MLLFLRQLLDNSEVKVLIIFIILDTIFGILRAIKNKKVNSAIGIDGLIRKAGMLLSIFFFEMVDFIIQIDFLFFLPQELKQSLSLETVGLGNLFCILFIVFELLSVLKNMVLCKIPIPKKLQNFLNKLLKEFTEEIKEGSENKWMQEIH